MNVFYYFYGGKWNGAEHFRAPQRDLVIEPFAGSAVYSCYWNHPNVILYDKDPVICELWRYLIHCSVDDINNIPDYFADNDAFEKLTGGARILVGMWMGWSMKRPALKIGATYNRYKDIKNTKVWSALTKDRIIRQKPLIANWRVENLSYEDIPNQRAHWFIDPPYDNDAGRKYTYNCEGIDYGDLARWCKERAGVAQVCEQVGADWLPFQPLYNVKSAGISQKISREAVYETGTGE